MWRTAGIQGFQVPAPVLPDEAARLAALRRYAILDTPPDEAFDRVARLAASLFQAPIGLVSFLDADRAWFKAHIGVEGWEIPRYLPRSGSSVRPWTRARHGVGYWRDGDRAASCLPRRTTTAQRRPSRLGSDGRRS